MLVTVGSRPGVAGRRRHVPGAAVRWGSVRIPRPQATEAGRPQPEIALARRVGGWDYLRDRSGLMALLLLFSSVNFLVASVNVLYIPLVLSFASPGCAGRDADRRGKSACFW